MKASRVDLTGRAFMIEKEAYIDVGGLFLSPESKVLFLEYE